MSQKLWRGNSIEWSESDGPSHKITKQLPKFDHHLGNFSTRLLDVGCNEHKVVERKAYEEGEKKSLVRRRSCSIDDKRLGLRHDKDQTKDTCNKCKRWGHWARDCKKKKQDICEPKENGNNANCGKAFILALFSFFRWWNMVCWFPNMNAPLAQMWMVQNFWRNPIS